MGQARARAGAKRRPYLIGTLSSFSHPGDVEADKGSRMFCFAMRNIREPQGTSRGFRRGNRRRALCRSRFVQQSLARASEWFLRCGTVTHSPARRVVCCLLFSLLATSVFAAARPNIIFILVDDQGYYDLGCYGATEVKTPRIDAMAKKGVRFTDYYAAAPICSPSRAGLLTGCYPRRIGNHIWVHRADSKSGIHPDELTLAELLKTGGYATACIGKWHLGFQEPFLPKNQGFDHYFGLLHNLDPVEVVYFQGKGGVPLMRNDKVVKRPADPAELTKLYTDEAIEFIKQQKDGPFFLYLPHTMLHNPLGVSEPFKGSSKWGEYGDAIQELDHHVGRIFDTLKELKIDDDAIVVYASDNGRGPGRTRRQQLRGRKLSTFEAGIRVPAIAWGPGRGVQSGQSSSRVVRAMDWYPTLATFAGIEVPQSRVIDGRDMSPLLKGIIGKEEFIPAQGTGHSLNGNVPLRRSWDPPGEWRALIKRDEYNEAFFYHGSHGALAAVRWQNWKLFLNPTLQLYDLEKDPGETKLVRDREVTRKLRGMAILFQEEMRRDARPAGDSFLEDASSAQRDALLLGGPMKAYDESIEAVAAKIRMIPIPGGNFRMGSPEDEPHRQKDEGPQHEVFISPFWMASTETTWDYYEAWVYEEQIRKKRGLKPPTDSKSKTKLSQPSAPYMPMDFGLGRGGRPAVNMTNYAASEFCKWLSRKTGKHYRLPTEAEWEYACRAGSETAFSWGDDEKEMEKYAWYYENSPDEYQKVGTLKPNRWGLYDMHGNVSEWVLDQYSPDGYVVDQDKPRLNPLVEAVKEYPRVYRGGCFEGDPKDLRSAKRFKSHPDLKMQDPEIPKSKWWNTDAYFIGFRIVRPFDDLKAKKQPAK